MAKRDLKKLFRGKESVAEELKEAKAIKSGKITPMQYAKGEKMEKPEKPEMRKFAAGGSASTLKRYDKPKAPYAENEGPYSITRKGGERRPSERIYDAQSGSYMSKKGATRQAKNDADSMYMGGEGLIEPYEKYKLSSDPSREEITKRLRKGDIKAERPLSRALRASADAEEATREEVLNKLKTSTKPKPGEYNFKKGGKVKPKVKTKCYAAGGSVSKGDGCATKGRTKGRIV